MPATDCIIQRYVVPATAIFDQDGQRTYFCLNLRYNAQFQFAQVHADTVGAPPDQRWLELFFQSNTAIGYQPALFRTFSAIETWREVCMKREHQISFAHYVDDSTHTHVASPDAVLHLHQIKFTVSELLQASDPDFAQELFDQFGLIVPPCLLDKTQWIAPTNGPQPT